MRRHVPVLATSVAFLGYFAQGIGPGLVQGIVLPTLASQGLPIQQQAWLLGAGTLPWLLKFVWATGLDRMRATATHPPIRVVGAATLIMSICLLTWASSDTIRHEWTTVLVVWSVHNIFASLQDTACDTAIVDLSTKRQLSVVQGAGFLARHLAQAVVVTMLFGALAAQGRLDFVIRLSAGILAVTGLALLILPGVARSEVPEPLAHEPAARVAFRSLFHADWQRHAFLAVTGLLVYGGFDAISAAFLFQKLNFSVADYQSYLVPLATAMSALGYLANTFLGARVTPRHLLAYGSIGLIVAWVSLACASPWWSTHTSGIIYTFAACEAICATLFLTGLHSLLLSQCSGAGRSTQLVALMCLLNLSRFLGLSGMAKLSTHLDFAPLFFAGAGVHLAWLTMAWTQTRRASRVFDLDADLSKRLREMT